MATGSDRVTVTTFTGKSSPFISRHPELNRWVLSGCMQLSIPCVGLASPGEKIHSSVFQCSNDNLSPLCTHIEIKAQNKSIKAIFPVHISIIRLHRLWLQAGSSLQTNSTAASLATACESLK